MCVHETNKVKTISPPVFARFVVLPHLLPFHLHHSRSYGNEEVTRSSKGLRFSTADPAAGVAYLSDARACGLAWDHRSPALGLEKRGCIYPNSCGSLCLENRGPHRHNNRRRKTITEIHHCSLSWGHNSSLEGARDNSAVCHMTCRCYTSNSRKKRLFNGLFTAVSAVCSKL